MGFISKLKKIVNSSSKGRAMLFEAFWTSLKYEYYLKVNKYNPIKHLHKENEEVITDEKVEPETMNVLRTTAYAIKIVEKYAPWKPMCYNRAMTAKEILSKRDVKTKMHIGFRKKDNQFDGHAWLTYNNILVTGKIKGLHSFKELKSMG